MRARDAGGGKEGAVDFVGARDQPAPARPRAGSRIRVLLVGVAILIGGFGASAYVASQRSSSVSQANSRSFQTTAGDVTGTLAGRIDGSFNLTRMMRAIATMEPIAGQRRYARWYQQLGSGAIAGFRKVNAVLIVPVAAAKLPTFERQQMADPTFAKQFGAGGFRILPGGRRATYCLERAVVGPPASGSAYPAGLDYCAPDIPGLGASPFLALIRSVTDTGSFIVTPVAGIASSSLVGIGAAVYRAGAPTATVAQRRAAAIGYIATTLDTTSLIGAALAGHASLAITLYHANPGEQLQRLAGGSRPGYRTRVALGEGWIAQVSGKAANAGSATTQGLVVFAIGALITGLLFLLYRVLALSRQRAWGLVGEKTVELEYRALHDPLTGLPNRHLVLDRAGQVLARARRMDVPVTVLFVDIDGFKQINDRFGHKTGDDVLRHVAERLSGVLRESDTVGRLGGDEFVLVLDCTGTDAAHPDLVAERILNALRKPLALPDAGPAPVAISASIGIASALADSAEDLLQHADIAMYQAKAAGKGGYVVFEASMQAAIADRLNLELDLADALHADQLYLDYQPVLNLSSGQVVSVEALLRWQHPTRGVIAPDGFIPIAEASGMIAPIGRWVLAQACQQAVNWRAKGHAIGVSVNISPRQFERPEFVGEVRSALDYSGLEPAWLTLEVTEAMLVRRPAATVALLTELKRIGVAIAVDDFGTGYSSLGYLRQFPIDSVKIDRSFVSDLASSAEADALTRTLIGLGKTLGIQTLAEGVEEDSQARQLHADGCDLAQGFLFARPLAPEALERFLEHGHGSPLEVTAARLPQIS
jgi:diguanylate cyclase (GGDEF)-like protein